MARGVKLEDLGLPVKGERFRLERSQDGAAVIRLADGVTVGNLKLEAGNKGLVVRGLCIEAPYRSYGAGSEAALLLNRACDAAGVAFVRTWAPPDRGLAVYFWIRMGYRPLHGEGPESGVSFERRRGQDRG